MLQVANTYPDLSVFITPELSRRPSRSVDLRCEKVAIHDLATHMLEAPQQILPRFVELAMEVAQGSSAGLSIYESGPPEGLRWHHLRGRLGSLTGTTIPKASPCGIAMDGTGPQLSHYPERVFTWIKDAGISLPEVLHIPLYLNRKKALGTLWVVADNPGHFDAEHARATEELASFVSIALRIMETERRLKEALVEQETLASEMTHRVKNILTIVDGLLRVSAKSAANPGELVRALSGRLQALAAAQALAHDGRRGPNQASGSDLRQLLVDILSPYAPGKCDEDKRIVLTGPKTVVGENAGQSLALVFHELATNAVKYGALSEGGGEVAVSWMADSKDVHLTWTERGGPAVVGAPGRTGFGSKLINDTLARRLGGVIDLAWRPEGLQLIAHMPVAGMSR
ncbi:MAG TPA: HWE histidine kinase domain-containing protein [Rhizomicrobium sp.]|nr:HWE histidine kinase domain-containing protein [Rhizomicrobium sp.]